MYCSISGEGSAGLQAGSLRRSREVLGTFGSLHAVSLMCPRSEAPEALEKGNGSYPQRCSSPSLLVSLPWSHSQFLSEACPAFLCSVIASPVTSSEYLRWPVDSSKTDRAARDSNKCFFLITKMMYAVWEIRETLLNKTKKRKLVIIPLFTQNHCKYFGSQAYVHRGK